MTSKNLLSELSDMNSNAILCTSESYIMNISYDGRFVILTEGCKMMGIKELRDKLSKMPEDAIIVFDHGYLDKNNDNILRYIAFDNTSNKKTRFVRFERKSDENVREELLARGEYMIENTCVSDQDMIQEAFDDGFTLHDFWITGQDVYEFAKKCKEEYGLTELQERITA